MKALDLERILQIEQLDSWDDKVLAAAVMYAEHGFYVVPLRPNSKILPPRATGMNYARASKNPDTVREWWTGKYAGFNIGLACGATDSICVLDIDTKNGKNGFVALELLEQEYGPVEAITQSTASGGRHYVFSSDGTISSSSDKISAGIDTRGGNGVNASHIVAWPSQVDGFVYEWENVGEFPYPPDWLLERLGTPWQSGVGAGTGRGNEQVGDSDVERQYPITELVRMLQYIDPDILSYDDWLRVGHALHSQHSDMEGLSTWDHWSARGERYQIGECAKRWGAFKDGGTVRIGTLIHFAKLGGYSPKPEIIEPPMGVSEFHEIIEEMNKEWAIAVVGGKVRIIGLRLNERPDMDFTLIGVDDFKCLMQNQKIWVTDAKGQPKAIPKAALWLGDEDRKTFEGGVVFHPNKPAEFDGQYNLWRGWSVKPEAGEWGRMKTHIYEVLCSGNQSHYEWLMDWMADLIQDPANPKGAALVMRGPEGAGKGTIVEAMGKLMGRHYKHLTQEEHLTGRFNGHLMDALLVFADEVVYGGSKKTAGTLKAMVTERRLTSERKGVDATGFRNCAHLVIASNEDWFVPAGPSSRRWFVLEVSGHRANDRKWFDDIHYEMDNGGYEAMMWELQHRVIKSDLKVAPVTKALQGQRAMYVANDSLVEWWASVVERGDIPHLGDGDIVNQVKWPSEILRTELFDQYEQWGIMRKVTVKPKAAFYSKMTELGLEQFRSARDGRPRCFRLPTVSECTVLLKLVGGIDIDAGLEDEQDEQD